MSKQTFTTRILLTTAALLLAAGCGGFRVNYDGKNPSTVSKKTADDVQLLRETPARKHVSLGRLEAIEEDTRPLTVADMLWKMRGRAAQAGCDAIVYEGQSLPKLTVSCIAFQ